MAGSTLTEAVAQLVLHPNTPREVAGTRAVIAAHAHGTDDEAELLLMLGLHPAQPRGRSRAAGRREEARAKCGTNRGYNAHLYRKQDPCEPCLAAHRAYVADRKAQGPKPGPQCGTEAGYSAHIRRKQAPCRECRDAANAAARARRAAGGC
jgi:hypothetical protein